MHNKVKFIQLSKLNEEQLLAVIVVEGNLVKNQIVNLDETIDDEQILKLNLLLNTQLNGLTIEEISLGMITKLKEQAGVHSGVVSTVLDAVADAIAVDDEEVPVYTSGATNIFKYPELADKLCKALRRAAHMLRNRIGTVIERLKHHAIE